MKEVIADYAHSARYQGNSAPIQASIRYGYDEVGNTIFTIDPRGVRTNFEINQLNQVVEVNRAADVSQAQEQGLIAYGYKSRIFYDANNNIVKTETEYRDGNNSNLPQWLTTTHTYDILDNLLSTTRTVDNGKTITTRLRYDANENLVETVSPMAVEGSQPGNQVRVSYDERDMPYQVTIAPGTPDEATITYIYDRNGNILETIGAEDNNGDGQGDATTYVYDGYDRRIKVIDAAGNEVRLKYDPASNVVKSEVWGSVGGPTRNTNSTVGNVLLASGYGYYDELSRLYQSESELFVPQGVVTLRVPLLYEGDLNPVDGRITSFLDYDRNSRLTFATAASPASALEMRKISYDGLGRTIQTEDPDKNQILTQYDKNSNPIRTTRIEKHPTGRVADKTFVSLHVYDSLNRLVRTTDTIGQTRRFYYDSRGLLTRSTDAQGSPIADPLGLYQGNINGDGNETEILQDGLGRNIRTIRTLAMNGQGGNPIDQSNPANPDGKIIENTTWDANSRVMFVSDDKGNLTFYEYDNANRLVKTTFADNTTKTVQYNRDSRPIRLVDNNGTVVNNTFDALARLVHKSINPAQGVMGTTEQTFQYDGMSRLTRATDNNNVEDAGDDSLVERRYDSLGRLLEEAQNGKAVSYNWSQAADLTDQTYPNGRKINYSLDRLNRLTAITESQSQNPIVTYDYMANRVLERTYANGVKLTMLNDAGNAIEGYDALGRLVSMRHQKGTTVIAGFSHGYNRENHKTYSENLTHPNLSEVYKYDSVYRLIDFQRGNLNATKDSITGTASQTQAWALDGVGNWATTTVDGTAKTQTVNNMNEYDAFAGTAQTHDDNGNLKDDGKYLLSFDFANRITAVRNKTDNTLVAKYTYDAFNRRISKEFTRTREEGGNGGEEGEYQTDSDTIALYHFNETTDQVQDSSGNNNHGKAPKKLTRGIEGLWNTNAVRFHGEPIQVKHSQSLDSIEDTLTVETWIYLKSPECKDKAHKHCWKKHIRKDCHHKGKCKCKTHVHWFCQKCWEKHWQGGALIERPSSYKLEISRHNRKAAFTLHLQEPGKRRCKNWRGEKVQVQSNAAIPIDQWVHIAAVYNGDAVKLYVNMAAQSDEKSADGDVKTARTPLLLGAGFFGQLEEVRISKTARTAFGNSGNGPAIVRETVHRSIYWSGWRMLEEHDRIAKEGQSVGPEKILRQIVDGIGIDEHLRVDYYASNGTTIDTSYYYQENAHNDIIAITDFNGDTVLQLAYSAYGDVYEIDENEEMTSFNNAAFVVYGFQAREIDETEYVYFRNRYYSTMYGRFLQRDPFGYHDCMGLYEAFGESPKNFGDPLGKLVEIYMKPEDYKEYLLKDTHHKIEQIKDIFNKFEKWYIPKHQRTLDVLSKEYDGGPCGPISLAMLFTFLGQGYIIYGETNPKVHKNVSDLIELKVYKEKEKFPFLPIFLGRYKGHMFNAIFIGNELTKEEMSKIENWVMVDLMQRTERNEKGTFFQILW